MAISTSSGGSIFRRLGHVTVLAIAVAGSLALHPSAATAADSWTVVERSGTVIERSSAGRTMPLRTGDIVSAGATVETGPDGRAVLRHHGHADTLTASPASRFTVPAARHSRTAPNIIQTMGTLLFTIEHTPNRRFEVDGPYLAAVVKGTVFSVTVAAGHSTVSVSRGAVEVLSGGSNQSVLIRPGQSANVSASGRHPISMGARQSSVTRVPGAANAGSASTMQLTKTVGDTHLDIGTLTHDLVTAVPAPGVPAISAHGASGSAGSSNGADPANRGSGISPSSEGGVPAMGIPNGADAWGIGAGDGLPGAGIARAAPALIPLPAAASASPAGAPGLGLGNGPSGNALAGNRPTLLGLPGAASGNVVSAGNSPQSPGLAGVANGNGAPAGNSPHLLGLPGVGIGNAAK